MCLDMLGVRLQPLECHYEPKEQGFIPSVDEARTLINESTRAILLVSPNNRKYQIYGAVEFFLLSLVCPRSNWYDLLGSRFRQFLRAMQRRKHRFNHRRDIQRFRTTSSRAFAQSLLQS